MTEEELKKLEEFEDIFGNTPFQNIQKIKEYIQNNFVSVDLYNKEKENNKELKKANKKLQADIEIKDKVIDLIIDDFQTEGYFKKMTYEQVKKYYDNRNELKQEINTLPLNLDLTAK